MIEKIESMKELEKKYNVVTGRKPKKNDLVYVISQGGIFMVEHADRLNVRVERGQKGSGLLLTLPPSHYKIVERKP